MWCQKNRKNGRRPQPRYAMLVVWGVLYSLSFFPMSFFSSVPCAAHQARKEARQAALAARDKEIAVLLARCGRGILSVTCGARLLYASLSNPLTALARAPVK